MSLSNRSTSIITLLALLAIIAWGFLGSLGFGVTPDLTMLPVAFFLYRIRNQPPSIAIRRQTSPWLYLGMPAAVLLALIVQLIAAPGFYNSPG